MTDGMDDTYDLLDAELERLLDVGEVEDDGAFRLENLLLTREDLEITRQTKLVRGGLQCLPITNDHWDADISHIRRCDRFEDDFGTDSRHVTHRHSYFFLDHDCH